MESDKIIERIVDRAFTEAFIMAQNANLEHKKGNKVDYIKLRDESLLKFKEEDKDFISRLHLIQKQTWLSEENSNLKWSMDQFGATVKADGNIEVTMVNRKDVMCKSVTKQNALIMADCLIMAANLNIDPK